MIDNINVHSKDSSQNSVTGISVNSKNNAKTTAIPTAEGDPAISNAESGATEESFQASLAKASKDKALETGSNADVTGSEAGGNVLPVVNELIDNTAENDRNLLSASSVPGINLQEIASRQQLKPAVETTIDSDIELTTQPAPIVSLSNKIETDPEPAVNLISSSIRQLLQAETKNQAQIIHPKTGKPVNLPNISEAILNNPLDAASLTTENADVLLNKANITGQLQELSTQQIQALANIKNSSLLQTATASAESGIEALPLALSPSSNTVLSTSLSSIIQPEITEQFGRPAWSQGMSKQILWMANQNIRSAEIRLNPANLGPIEVRIDMSDDQINVALSSRHAVVREAMEMALPKLREMLDENGFNLADADISQHSFAEQREQNMASGKNSFFSDSATQNEFVDTADGVIRQAQLDTGMIDYYI